MLILLSIAACGGDDGLTSASLDEIEVTSVPTQTDDTVFVTERPPDSDNIIEPPLELPGSSWNAQNYEMQASTGFTNVLDGTDVQLEFGVDGRLSGFNTCNSYVASWLVEGPYYEQVPTLEDDPVLGQAISITDLVFEERSCPEGFESEQQADIFASLLGADRWRLSDEGKLLLSGDGIFIDAEQID